MRCMSATAAAEHPPGWKPGPACPDPPGPAVGSGHSRPTARLAGPPSFPVFSAACLGLGRGGGVRPLMLGTRVAQGAGCSQGLEGCLRPRPGHASPFVRSGSLYKLGATFFFFFQK